MAELKTLSKLKMAGKLNYWRGTIAIDEYELHKICDEIQAEHDRAIATTLEDDDRYDARFANGVKTVLPCPFCGSEADMAEMTTKYDGMTFFKALCNDPFCPGANIHMWYKTKAEAIAAWNTRTEQALTLSERLRGDAE